MNRVFATILAVETRRRMAESLVADCLGHGVSALLSINDVKHDFGDAFLRFRELIKFATLQRAATWHLFLEDDQEITQSFWDNLQRLMDVGESYAIDTWYLSNRNVDIGQLGYIEEFRTNRILSWAPGSHGLLYKQRHARRLLKQETPMPIDFIFWKTMDPHKFRHFQVCRPVMAIHRGEQSSLYHYKNTNHVATHPLEI